MARATEGVCERKLYTLLDFARKDCDFAPKLHMDGSTGDEHGLDSRILFAAEGRRRFGSWSIYDGFAL